MDAARRGIITPEMKTVAAKEYRTEDEIRELVAKGQVAICANKLHTCIGPHGADSMLRTKINVNLGVSKDCKDYDVEMQDVVRLHAEDGVDFVTLHCGITRKTIEQIKKHKRKMNIVSRGGSLVFAWMSMTGQENPFYEYFDEILDICREYDVTISLGDACLPGSQTRQAVPSELRVQLSMRSFLHGARYFPQKQPAPSVPFPVCGLLLSLKVPTFP